MKTTKTFHTSWLIMWLSVGVLVGAYLSLYTFYFVGFEWFVIALGLMAIAFVHKKITAVFLIICAGLLIGLWRGGGLLQAQNMFEEFYDTQVLLIGFVSEDPSYSVDGSLRMKLENIVIDEIEIPGEVWMSTSDRIEIKRSDVVEVRGKLSSGFGNISAALYRGRIVSVEREDYVDIARDVRDEFGVGIRRSIREPEASLGAGFLVGQKTALPEKLDQEMRMLGLTHIVVASGYNLTILTRFARRSFARISRFTALSLSSSMVYCFALVTGFSPSMSRASLIAFLSLLAWYFGRKFHPLVLLSFSAAITVLINPSYAWGDIGWLLSFTSFIGVIMLSPLIHAYLWGDKKPGNIRQVFIETMSAQLLTLPIIAYVFGQYSPLALVANVLILPLIPIAMLLTFFAGIGGLLFIPIASIIGWPAETLLGYMTAVVDRLAQLPLAGAEIGFNMSTVIIGYVFIVIGMIYLWRRTRYPFRNYNIIE